RAGAGPGLPARRRSQGGRRGRGCRAAGAGACPEPRPASQSGLAEPVHGEAGAEPGAGARPRRGEGACGSCWAVATVSALEAHREIHAKRRGKLSVQ
ncbi:unnamed protein product, partial [Prorocentrum cordatum]